MLPREAMTMQRDPNATRPKPLQVMWGLSGNSTAFLEEFEVSLKSVLLKAPIDAEMDVHLIVDYAAFLGIKRYILEPHRIVGSRWRRLIMIHVYLVTESTKERYKRSGTSRTAFPTAGSSPRSGWGSEGCSGCSRTRSCETGRDPSCNLTTTL